MAVQGSRRLAATAARKPAVWSNPLAAYAFSACPAERRPGTSWPERLPASFVLRAALLECPPLPPRGCCGSRRAFGDISWPTQQVWEQAPKAWDHGTSAASAYTAEEIDLWRADFGFARRQHSLAQFGYTDDELLEWRKPFDELACGKGIDFKAFETFVTRKYGSIIPEDELKQKVQFFWEKFDRDGNSFIDFGEFIVAGFLFDVTCAKEKIRREGMEECFRKYAVDEFMTEAHLFELMCDFRFFVSTVTDVHKLMRVADQDGDGLVSLSDFVQWASDEELYELLGDGRAVEGQLAKDRKRRGGKKRRSLPPRPPSEPMD